MSQAMKVSTISLRIENNIGMKVEPFPNETKQNDVMVQQKQYKHTLRLYPQKCSVWMKKEIESAYSALIRLPLPFISVKPSFYLFVLFIKFMFLEKVGHIGGDTWERKQGDKQPGRKTLWGMLGHMEQA